MAKRGARRNLHRRDVCCAGLVFCSWFLFSGHSPWGQWSVYRQEHLLILSSRQDPSGYLFSKRLTALFGEFLPAAKARAARARDFARVHSLLSTGQFAMVILSRDHALDLHYGRGVFTGLGAVEMGLVYLFSDFALLALPQMEWDHVGQVAGVIARHWRVLGEVGAMGSPGSFGIGLHPGAARVLGF